MQTRLGHRRRGPRRRRGRRHGRRRGRRGRRWGEHRRRRGRRGRRWGEHRRRRGGQRCGPKRSGGRRGQSLPAPRTVRHAILRLVPARRAPSELRRTRHGPALSRERHRGMRAHPMRQGREPDRRGRGVSPVCPRKWGRPVRPTGAQSLRASRSPRRPGSRPRRAPAVQPRPHTRQPCRARRGGTRRSP